MTADGAAPIVLGLRGIEWVELAFPDVNIARARKRARTRSSNFLPRRSIASSMLDYEGSSTELVGSSGAELRHNPLSFQLKTRLLRARAGARERPDIIKKHPLKTSKTLN